MVTAIAHGDVRFEEYVYGFLKGANPDMVFLQFICSIICFTRRLAQMISHFPCVFECILRMVLQQCERNTHSRAMFDVVITFLKLCLTRNFDLFISFFRIDSAIAKGSLYRESNEQLEYEEYLKTGRIVFDKSVEAVLERWVMGMYGFNRYISIVQVARRIEHPDITEWNMTIDKEREIHVALVNALYDDRIESVKQCDRCGRKSRYLCTQCKMVWFCSRRCYKRQWKYIHRMYCKKAVIKKPLSGPYRLQYSTSSM